MATFLQRTRGASFWVVACALVAVGLFAQPAAAADKPVRHFPFSYLGNADRHAKAPGAIGSRVLGGAVATPKTWPWQVALIQSGKKSVYDGQFCGGSMITTQWVLTAAHCVYDETDDGDSFLLKPADIKVLAGTNLLEDGTGDLVEVVEVHPHPGYDAVAIDNDLALLKLARIPRIDPLTPVKLPTKGAEDQLAAAGTQATVIGWGRLENGDFPKDLRQVRIRILDRRECNQAIVEAREDKASDLFQRVIDTLDLNDDVSDKVWKMMTGAIKPPLTDNMICSGSYAGGKGSCNGDSGGPLMVALADGSFLQVGIVSWGFTGTEKDSCDVEAEFSAFTRVANYSDWLTATIEGK